MTTTDTQAGPEAPALLDTTQAAEALGVKVPQLRKIVREGLLRHYRIGRNISIPRSAIDEFLAGGSGGR